MQETKQIPLDEFETECSNQNFSKYVFTSENQDHNDNNLKFALSFDSVKVIYYSTYNCVYLGDKDNHIILHRVVRIEEDLDFNLCKIYAIYCATDGDELRRYELTACIL